MASLSSTVVISVWFYPSKGIFALSPIALFTCVSSPGPAERLGV